MMQRHKTFFALARGFFPVHELCGALTVLAWARAELTSPPAPPAPGGGGGGGGGSRRHRSWLRLLWPAVALHAAANYRGMKPLFVWPSHRPWQEMQLQVCHCRCPCRPRLPQLALNPMSRCPHPPPPPHVV